MKVEYGSTANNLLCTGTTLAPAPVRQRQCHRSAAMLTGSTWWVGSRTQWNVTKDFYMGLDVMYSKMQSANLGARTGQLFGTLHDFQQPRALGRRWYGCRGQTRTTGRSGSASIATSIPDRVIMDV